MHAALRAFPILFVPGLSVRTRRKVKSSSSCSQIGCGTAYNWQLPCQCNDQCRDYSNCCSDYGALCEASATCSGRCGSGFDSTRPCQCNLDCSRFGDCCSDYSSLCEGSGPSPSPSPSPSPPSGPAPPPSANATQYWAGVNLNSQSAVQSRLQSGTTRLSYGDLWEFYKDGWVNLPGGCQGGVYDVYSRKCWTPGSGQCGQYGGEGDCYNREHSWPKSWWGGSQNTAYTDVFHVMPSDGYVNGRRSSFPFGEVNSPSYTSSEGNKVGSCSTPGISGTCFEPTDRVKGLLARGNLYVSVRYRGQFSCCAKEAVDGAELTQAYTDLMLQWHGDHPPQEWEVEFNNRAESWQGNRNPFIDYPEAADQIFR